MSYYYNTYDSDSEDDHYYPVNTVVHTTGYAEVVQPAPAYCSSCDRTFLNEHNLQQHLRSHIHRGTNTLCPFCSRSFSTATGLIHHLERGSCPRAPGINREEIFRIMKQRDPNGYVTNLLLKYETPTYTTSNQSWNGRAWQCYFCNREFRTKNSLNQHLNSPVHQQNLYHCPNRRTCNRQFTTLAAAVNHLESERCGYMTFNQVQNTMGNLIGSDRRLTF